MTTSAPKLDVEDVEDVKDESENTSEGCCNCKCEAKQQDNDQDICIVEGSDLDKSQSAEGQGMTKTVWGKVKPPKCLGMYQPTVSARRTEVTRAKLVRQISHPEPAPSKIFCQCEPNISKVSFGKF